MISDVWGDGATKCFALLRIVEQVWDVFSHQKNGPPGSDTLERFFFSLSLVFQFISPTIIIASSSRCRRRYCTRCRRSCCCWTTTKTSRRNTLRLWESSATAPVPWNKRTPKNCWSGPKTRACVSVKVTVILRCCARRRRRAFLFFSVRVWTALVKTARNEFQRTTKEIPPRELYKKKPRRLRVYTC